MPHCFSLARLRGAGPTFPYRNGSQDTGRGAKASGCQGREGRTSVRFGTPTASERRRIAEGLRTGSGRGVARAGAGHEGSSGSKWLWRFIESSQTGGKARQRGDLSGRRQGGRKTRARTASEHLAPFLIPDSCFPKSNGTRLQAGGPVSSGIIYRVRSTCAQSHSADAGEDQRNLAGSVREAAICGRENNPSWPDTRRMKSAKALSSCAIKMNFINILHS